MGFIDQMRAEGYAVESIVRVLREQGVKIAARTYRAWARPRIAARTVTDALVVDAVRDAAWTDVVDAAGVVRRKMTPEGVWAQEDDSADPSDVDPRCVSRCGRPGNAAARPVGRDPGESDPHDDPGQGRHPCR
jgi:hypothetical protein